MRVFGLLQRAMLLVCFLQPAWCCAAPEPGEAWDESAEVAEPEVEEAGYLQDAIPFEDPAQEAMVQALVDQAVAARLAGMQKALLQGVFADEAQAIEDTNQERRMSLNFGNIYYAKQLKDNIKAVTGMIEPIMILAMGTVVGFIAMAIILPIFKMSQLVK
jgi:hypothetical protein